MLRVVYDHQIFWQQKFGGISRYFYDLATQMFKFGSLDIKILAGLYINGYLRTAEPGLVIGTSIPKIPKTGLAVKTFNKIASEVWLRLQPADIVHETFYSADGVGPRESITVLTVYDFMDEIFSPHDSIIGVKALAIRRADHLICISQSTKKDLLERFDIDPKKISVIYPGVGLADAFLTNAESQFEDEQTAKVNSPYLLFVGNRSGYKNFNRLLQAYASSKALVKDFKLVCFGSVPLQKQEIEFASSLGVPDGNLLWFSGDDSYLASFYRQASALIFPSLYEGFGNPPLEALAIGCPVICSNTSSMPEVSGDAAEYFSPYDIESMAIAMERVLYSETRSQMMIKRGRARAEQFSLKSSAEKVKNLYLSLV